jgi:hypothetical protein
LAQGIFARVGCRTTFFFSVGIPMSCVYLLRLAFLHVIVTSMTLDKPGFQSVRANGNPVLMQQFVTSLVEANGGRVVDTLGLSNFSQAYQSWATSFADLNAAIAQKPGWAKWDEFAACVASRYASSTVLSNAIDYACGNMKYFRCSNVPANCKLMWHTADYIFSIFYEETQSAPYPACSFNGAAIFQPANVYSTQLYFKSGCVITKDSQTTPLTDEGYQAIVRQNITARTSTFIQRLAASKLSGPIFNTKQLADWSSNPPSDLYSLTQWLPTLLQGAPQTHVPISSASFCGRWIPLVVTLAMSISAFPR